MAILYTYISKHTISRSHLSIKFIIYPLVALEFGIILPGFPNTMLSSGTSKLTNAPGAISTLFPIFFANNNSIRSNPNRISDNRSPFSITSTLRTD